MSYGNPHDVPCSEVLDRLCSYLDSAFYQMGYEKIGPAGNEAALEQPVEGATVRQPPEREGEAIRPRRARCPSPRCRSTRAAAAATGSSWPGRLPIRAVRRGLHGRGASR